MSRKQRFDDEFEGGFEKFTHRKGTKKKDKGHLSRKGEGERWAEIMDREDIDTKSSYERRSRLIDTPAFHKRPVVNAPYTPSQAPSGEKKAFVPGPNSHTIHNVVIDYDGVAAMEKLDNEFKGKQTHGIKYTFRGAGKTRVIWFNQNARERDRVYNEEYSFWTSLPSKRK